MTQYLVPQQRLSTSTNWVTFGEYPIPQKNGVSVVLDQRLSTHTEQHQDGQVASYKPEYWDWAAEVIRKTSGVINALHYKLEILCCTRQLSELIMWNLRLAMLARTFGVPYVTLSSGHIFEGMNGKRGCSPRVIPPLTQTDDTFLFWQIEKDTLLHGGHVVRMPEMFGRLDNPLSNTSEILIDSDYSYRIQLNHRQVALSPLSLVATQLKYYLNSLTVDNEFPDKFPSNWLTPHRVINLGIVDEFSDASSWAEVVTFGWEKEIDTHKHTLNEYGADKKSWNFVACETMGRSPYYFGRTTTKQFVTEAMKDIRD